jgi:hypothetical protein
MWPDTFEQRLAEWANLKQTCAGLDLAAAAIAINDWWFRAPLVNHHIHRQDMINWPDPWELLNDNLYCDLARALGIVYTLMDLDQPDIHDISIAYTENDNLVLINQGLYILNWAPGTVLNINSINQDIKRIVAIDPLKNKYN